MSAEMRVPQPGNFGMIITERAIQSGGSGPFYMYSPGITFYNLRSMVYIFDSIPAGQIQKIRDGESWTRKEWLPDGAAQKERDIKHPVTGMIVDRHYSFNIPAEVTLDALISDRSMTNLGLIAVRVFDNLDVAYEAFSRFIHPVNIPASTYPKEYKTLFEDPEAGGMLGLRRRWLEDAMESLDTGHMLEEYKSLIDKQPFLREVWREAIEGSLLPANRTFTTIANSLLAATEEQIRAGRKETYEPFDDDIMWLLGRKPERTALSRTMDKMSAGGSGGLTAEQVTALVESLKGQSELARQQIQCDECGEFLNMVKGGPPRKCRYCGFSFESVGAVLSMEPQEVTRIDTNPVLPKPNVSVNDIAASMLKSKKE